MNTNEHEQHLLNAEKARLGLAADLHDINHVGGRLIRNGEKHLKSSAVVLGATALGGLAVGVVVGRASAGRRGNALASELLGRATTAFATTLATQLLAMLFAKRSRESVT
jgi:hypothetical protein